MSTELQANASVSVALEPALQERLCVTAKTYLSIQQDIKRLEKQAAEALTWADAILDDAGASTAEAGGYRLTRIHGTRTSLSKEKLIALGVTTAMLTDATEIKPNKPYVKVSRVADGA